MDYMKPPKNFESPNIYRLRRIFTGGTISMAMLKTVFKGNEATNIRNNFEKFDQFKDKIDPLLHRKTNNFLAKKDDRLINGIESRVYTPISYAFTPQSKKDAPIFIYYHGGGFFCGYMDSWDDYLSQIAIELNAVTISVNYRLAPENPFPIPTEDCYSVTKYILESNGEFGNTNKVIIAGDSAGGNIAAVITHRLKKENIKMPRLQVLIYPWTQMFNLRLPSSIKYQRSAFFCGRGTKWYLGIKNQNKIGHFIQNNYHSLLLKGDELKKLKSYTDVNLIPKKYKSDYKYYERYNENDVFPKRPDSKKDADLLYDKKTIQHIKKLFTPELSPGLADPEMLKDLPNAYFIMTEMDPLKDEGLIYAERLKNEGVNVNVNYYTSSYHCCSQMVGKKGYEVSREMLADMIKYIKKLDL